MKLTVIQSRGKCQRLFPSLFLGMILCNVCATLGEFSLLPAALVGVLVPLALPFIPQKRTAVSVFSGLLLVLGVLRFSSILDGMQLLANRVFYLSEQTQAYEYDYFTTAGDNSVEAMLWISLLLGLLCALWGSRVNALLCGAWVAAMAYFGVTPDAVWLVLLLLTAVLCGIQSRQRWFYGIVSAVLIVGIAFGVMQIAPQPIKAVSQLDEQLRDVLAAAPMTYEQTPVPTEVPAPELTPPPNLETEQPDHGVQSRVINILFLILSVLTLAMLFIPAVIKDRAEKLREKNRQGIRNRDNTAAIMAMYRYAQRWRGLNENAEPIPEDVYAIWQEAAYSDHAMTAGQREAVYQFMEATARAVWAKADFRKRLMIQYCLGL